MLLLLLRLLLLRGKHGVMGELLCWHAVRSHVAVLWCHLLLIPQRSGREVRRMHQNWRLHILLAVCPNCVSAAAAVLIRVSQLPLAGCSWLGLLTPDGRPSPADAAGDRHGVIARWLFWSDRTTDR